MESRKGLIIRSLIKSGKFWVFFGVGSYCFSKYKVAWLTLDRKQFKAVVVNGRLQGNQAMHAYIPSESLKDAKRIRNKLNEILPEFLSGYEMHGTGSWSQPGKVKKLLSYKPT